MGGTYLKMYTDEQVQILLNQLYGLADLIVDQTLAPGSNKSPGVIDPDTRKEQNGS